MTEPAASIDDAERRLGRRFPADYRRYIDEHSPGAVVETAECYVELLPMDLVTGVNELPEMYDPFPDLVRFGGDSSREHLAFDYRTDPPRVVLVDISAAGEESLVEQSRSFGDFLASLQRRGLFFGT